MKNLFKKRVRKGQTAVEFIIIFGAALFFFLLFLLVINEQTADKKREHEVQMLEEVAKAVKDEISLATQSSNGYLRQFSIPSTLDGKNYQLKIIDDMINVKTNRDSLSLPVYHVEGQIQIGQNIIKKDNGLVYLNS